MTTSADRFIPKTEPCGDRDFPTSFLETILAQGASINATRIKERIDAIFNPYIRRPSGEIDELVEILEAAAAVLDAGKALYRAQVTLEQRFAQSKVTQGRPT